MNKIKKEHKYFVVGVIVGFLLAMLLLGTGTTNVFNISGGSSVTASDPVDSFGGQKCTTVCFTPDAPTCDEPVRTTTVTTDEPVCPVGEYLDTAYNECCPVGMNYDLLYGACV